MLLSSYGFQQSQPKRIAVTVAAQPVAVAGYALYIRLDDMPAGFWDGMARRDGGDIRVRTAAGAELPFDLVSLNPIARTGTLFAKVDISASGPTAVYVHFGGAGDLPVPWTDPNGRHAVWSAFHRVFMMGDSFADRSGKGSDLVPGGLVYGLVSANTSPNLGVHQGIAWDGVNYFAIGTNVIKKYDASFNLISQNTNPVASVPGTNHLGDSEVVGEHIYVPMEQYTDPDGHANMYIGRFLKSDLSFVDATPVAYASGVPSGVDMSGCAYNPADGLLYFGAWTGAGTRLWKYDMAAKQFIGVLNLSAPVLRMQGLTFWRGAIFINRDDTDQTVRVELDGTVKGMVWGIVGGSYEGISHTDDALLVLHDPSGDAGVVRTLRARQPRLISNELGAYIAGAGHYRADGLSQFSTWTMGGSASTMVTGSSRAIMSYTVTGSDSGAGGNVNRATLAYRSIDRWGFWNSSDSWINNASAPGTQTPARLHAVQKGSSGRELYVNGSLAASSASSAIRPGSGSGHSLYIGCNDAQVAEVWDGNIGYSYIYPGDIGASWISTEGLNFTNPTAFYSVGSVE